MHYLWLDAIIKIMGTATTSEYDSASWAVAKVRPDYTLLKNKVTSELVRLYNKVLVDAE